MRMHLHTMGRAQRLSRDMDAMTAATAGEVDDAVRNAFGPMAYCQAVRPRPGARAGQKPRAHRRVRFAPGRPGIVKMDFGSSGAGSTTLGIMHGKTHRKN